MNSKLRKDILAETYKDMRGLISEAAYKFWRTHGGDLDDLKAQANLIFIHAVDDYDSSKGAKISTWIAFRIKKRLLDYMRSGYVPTHYSIGDGHDDDFEFESKSNENFSAMELLDEMEQDAHIVLCLFLSTPKEVILSIFNDKNFRYDHAGGKMRNRLRNRLRQMDWTIRRIRKAFEEIKSVTSY
jgi:DNA-directed RNA polymerase specialized sigma subunit